MKYIALFFFLFEATSYASSVELNMSSYTPRVDALQENSPSAKHSNIRQLPAVQMPRKIVIKSKNHEFNSVMINNAKQGNTKKSVSRNLNIPADNEQSTAEHQPIDDIKVKTVASSTTGGSTTVINKSKVEEKFCEVYDAKTDDVVQMYHTQIQKMDSTSSVNMDPQKYFCLAFSNLMLLEENTSTPNTTYIANAKSDIKKAITANTLVTGDFKIDIIEDRFLTAIFDKYNQIATKGMDDEQKALAADAIKEPQLLALKQQLDSRNTDIESNTDTSDTLKNADTADLTPDYTKNPLPLLNSVKNTNGDVETETQTLRNFRATEDEMNSTETRIGEMLEVIQGLDASER